MKRDWDVIREVLIEVESLPEAERQEWTYSSANDDAKGSHAILLWKTGFIEGLDASSMHREAVLAPHLTWMGHDLLDTLRSKPVWERVKSMASEKGLELTFEAVKLLAAKALTMIIGA